MKKNKRLIALSDVHGEFGLLKELIVNQVKFDPGTDMLLMLGDYIDRSPGSKQVVEYVSHLKEHYPDNVILLEGSHEELAFYALTGTKPFPYLDDPMRLWLLNGGKATLDSYGGLSKTRKELVPFIESLQLYHETDTHIFAHGGIPEGENLKTATAHELLWDRDLSYRGKKTLVVGHTPHQEVTVFEDIVCIDTGAFMSGRLSAYDCLSGTVYEAIENRESELSLRLLRRR